MNELGGYVPYGIRMAAPEDIYHVVIVDPFLHPTMDSMYRHLEKNGIMAICPGNGRIFIGAEKLRTSAGIPLEHYLGGWIKAAPFMENRSHMPTFQGLGIHFFEAVEAAMVLGERYGMNGRIWLAEITRLLDDRLLDSMMDAGEIVDFVEQYMKEVGA